METAPATVDLPYIDRKFTRPVIENSGTIVISEEELAALSEEEREAIEKDIAQSEQKPEADCEAIEGACDLGKSGMANIAICNKDNPIYSYVYFVNTDQNNPINNNPEDTVEISMSDDIDGIELSAEEGHALALEALADMNINGMELVKMAKVPLGNARNDKLSYCYEFAFSRPVGGIPSTYALAEGLSLDNERVSETWDQEYIEIYIDDSGILKFNWDSPTQLGETINENVSLKPFDEILSIFKQQIINHCVFTDEAGVIERRITIDEITLGMMKIKQQDSNRYIYVPVWDFFGYSLNTYDETSQYVLDESGQKKIDEFGHSFLTINAIDGSIIDRSLGY